MSSMSLNKHIYPRESVVEPLLQALRAHTDWHITLIAGRIIDGKVKMKSAHAGKTQHDDDHTDWDPKGYKTHFLDQFWCFLVAASKAQDIFLLLGNVPRLVQMPTAARHPHRNPPLVQGINLNVLLDNDIPPLDNDDDPPADLGGSAARGSCVTGSGGEGAAPDSAGEHRRVGALAHIIGKQHAELAHLKNLPVPAITNEETKKRRRGKGSKKVRVSGVEDEEMSALSSSESDNASDDGSDGEGGVRAEPPKTRGRGHGLTGATSTGTAPETKNTRKDRP
ncbi:hypothetical protein DFH06DRAFT_1130483 [Mycena polygramma]|nr:hypothetical protein DFH06DRAFT_1130483 [Mycena polygramma]